MDRAAQRRSTVVLRQIGWGVSADLRSTWRPCERELGTMSIGQANG